MRFRQRRTLNGQDRHRLNQLTAQMVAWLDTLASDRVLETVSRWDQATWQLAESVIATQGIGPYLRDMLPRTPIYAALPQPFRQWLAAEYAMNEERVRRLHQDLAAILRDANQAGIAVMPLKGGLLSARYYAAPALRPMADLDLLIQPEDEPALTALLEKRGYQYVYERIGNEHHRKFAGPGGHAVISPQSEHPDNPRPVEVHTELTRALWGRFASYDLTAFIWAESSEIELLGERAWSPAPDRLLTYLAAHALDHFFCMRGRVLHWLDLALVTQAVQRLDPPDANWVYPPLALAARGLPGRFTAMDFSDLAQRTHPWLRQWAESVPLDGQCGLTLDEGPDPANWWKHELAYWRPSPWRLALAYGHKPLPLMVVQHLATALNRTMRRRPVHV